MESLGRGECEGHSTMTSGDCREIREKSSKQSVLSAVGVDLGQ